MMSRVWRAHPRSRGENVDGREDDLPAEGSSPLTRGKHGLLVHAGHVRGLIPAHAGKTIFCALFFGRIRAHPRSRGENSAHIRRLRRRRGSSPLTRGKLDELGVIAAHAGLIPAHAGKTTQDAYTALCKRAHPRSRGENRTRGIEVPGFQGSSPLTRGKLGPAHVGVGSKGLIPAHAGKTHEVSHPTWDPWAHPRSRGENNSLIGSLRHDKGSSPLTRGKRPQIHTASLRRGLIPAHAGKTPPRRTPSRLTGAHPRSRGENTLIRADDKTFKGSSPLTRGKRNEHLQALRRSGLIPAHAGKTRLMSAGMTQARAHPRSRGENATT